MSRSAQPAPDPSWLNKSQMAASLGISVQAFDKWGVKPVARIGRSVYFDCRSVLDAKLAELEAKHQSSQPDGADEGEFDPLLEHKRDQEEYLLTKERRIGQQQKNELAARKVVPSEFAIFTLSKVAAEIAAILDTLPLVMKRKHPDLETRHLDTLMRELARARNQASGLDEKLPELLDDFFDSIDSAA
ncbi:terminase small subunit [Halomonas sabkhae]|nr:terminase small subunit [Halomonas sabkhae]MDN3525648.1 terminase small subunit [Halomonas sabkhae]